MTPEFSEALGMPSYWLAVLLTALLAGLTIVLHYEALQQLNRRMPNWRLSPHPRVLVMMFCILVVHILEIWIFALGIFLAVDLLGLGQLVGIGAVAFPGRRLRVGDHLFHARVRRPRATRPLAPCFRHGGPGRVPHDHVVGVFCLPGNEALLAQLTAPRPSANPQGAARGIGARRPGASARARAGTTSRASAVRPSRRQRSARAACAGW